MPMKCLFTLAVLSFAAMPDTGAQAQSDVTSALEPVETDLSAEEWRSRIDEARRRSHEFVEKAKAGKLLEPIAADEDARIADERALGDSSLQKGDIVSTSKGFFVFLGRKEDETSGGFLKLPAGSASQLNIRENGR